MSANRRVNDVKGLAMAINLVKGQRIGIGLSRVGVGLGWDPNENSDEDFDLDASAFMIGANKKIKNDDWFIFYNSDNRVLPSSPLKFEPFDGSKYPAGVDKDGNPMTADEHWRKSTRPAAPNFSVLGSIDDRTGGSSKGDDETINVDLMQVPPEVEEIIFVVSIYDADKRKQNFGQVRNSFIRIYDEGSGEEICKYELGEDFSVETCIEFGRLYRREGAWKFEAMGIGHKGGLQELVNKYG
jgi:tellurium resistance protein TerD